MNEQQQDQVAEEKGDNPLQCGLVMPISAIDGCSAEHWLEVRSIITEAVQAIDSPKFVANMVSDGDDAGVIQRRIVQGVHGSEIVVCDISAKNPNVMLELGMRLAFGKPVVIIKDDQTICPFDAGVIENLTYPRDLRFSKIVTFKKNLAEKVRATYLSSLDPASTSSFLKNFGPVNIVDVRNQDISSYEMIMEALGDIRRNLKIQSSTISLSHSPVYDPLKLIARGRFLLSVDSVSDRPEIERIREILKYLLQDGGLSGLEMFEVDLFLKDSEAFGIRKINLKDMAESHKSS